MVNKRKAVLITCVISAGLYIIKVFKDKKYKRNQNNIYLNQFYSKTYNEARNKFRKISNQIPNAKTHIIKVSSNDDITIDLCFIPSNNPDNKNLLISTSGTHGVEGYAGSAIQCKILNDIQSNIENSNNQETNNVLLIHSINGYGMKYNRRFNKNNVDLNRSCILDKHLRNKLKQEVWKENTVHYLYDKYKGFINPDRKPIWLLDDILYPLKTLYWLIKIGSIKQFSRVFVNGQYHDPKGCFFGGNTLQNEIKYLTEFIVKDCVNVWNIDLYDLCKNNLFIIDLHTGLGKHGIDTLLTDQIKCANLMKQYVDNEYIIHKNRIQTSDTTGIIDTKAKNRISRMYGSSRGGLKTYLILLFMDKNRYLNPTYYDDLKDDNTKEYENKLINEFNGFNICGITQEFGTVSGYYVAKAVILENMIYHRIYNNSDQNIWKYRANQCRKVFYCENSVHWKESVLTRGVKLFHSFYYTK